MLTTYYEFRAQLSRFLFGLSAALLILYMYSVEIVLEILINDPCIN